MQRAVAQRPGLPDFSSILGEWKGSPVTKRIRRMTVGNSMRNGCVILTLALAVIITGCGTKPGDKLTKDKIEVLNSMAAEFEKVTDKASMDKALAEVVPLGKKLDQIEKDFAALPEPAKETARAAHKDEMEKATARFTTAKEQARQKAK
jgi:hypothetical protein